MRRAILPAGSGALRAALLVLVFVASLGVRAESVTIGAEDDWYPYGGKIEDKPAGFGVDLVRAAFGAVGISVEFLSVPYARCLELVRRGELLACNEPARTDDTEHTVLWPDKPLFVARSLIYARAPSTERGLSANSLKDKIVAVTHGFEYGSAFDNNKTIRRETVLKESSVFKMLAAGRADYALAYEKVANWIFAQHAGEFQGKFVAVGKIDEVRCYTAFSKTFPNSARYLAKFNEGFAKIVKDGTYREIEKRYP